MTRLADYQHKYKYVAFERHDDGVLEMRIHDNGGAAKWTAHPGGIHEELGYAFYDVGRDLENRVVIFTGTGDIFLTEFDPTPEDPDAGTPLFWDRIFKEGRDLLMNLLEIEVPVIGVVNGPVTIHSELPTMSDIVLAADDAIFADKVHTTNGYVAGDGVHVWWQMLLGPNRGRHFLLTGDEIDAPEAKRLGFVAEIHPRETLMDRARELAHGLAKQHRTMLRSSRVAFTQHIKRRMLDDLGYGLQLEALSAMSLMHDMMKGQK
jgi:enoyl-CoA hydratase/carnithine racemase